MIEQAPSARPTGARPPTGRLVGAYAICAVCWGTTWYAIRLTLGSFGPAPGVAFRFAMAAVVFGAVLLYTRPEVDWRRHGPLLILAGLLNAVAYVAVYQAETAITGGLAAVVYATFPLVTAALAAIWRLEPIAVRQVLGGMLGVAGVGLLFAQNLGVPGSGQRTGLLLVLLSVVFASLQSVLVKRYARDAPTVAVNVVHAAVTSVAMFAVWGALFPAQPASLHDPVANVSVIYLALVGTVATFGAYFYLLRHVAVMTLSTLVLITPVIALAVDALAGEGTPGPIGLAGAAVILAGVAATIRWREPGRPDPPADQRPGEADDARRLSP